MLSMRHVSTASRTAYVFSATLIWTLLKYLFSIPTQNGWEMEAMSCLFVSNRITNAGIYREFPLGKQRQRSDQCLQNRVHVCLLCGNVQSKITLILYIYSRTFQKWLKQSRKAQIPFRYVSYMPMCNGKSPLHCSSHFKNI